MSNLKILSISLLLTGVVYAQNDIVIVDQGAIYSSSMTEATLEVGLASAYIDRGQVINSDPVIQPQITLSQHGFSVNVWGNFDLGSNNNDVSSDFSEFDFSFAYSFPVDLNQMAVDIGMINYNYPGNGGVAIPSTTELFLTTTILSFQDTFIPSLTIFGDIEESPGVYALLDVFIPYEVSGYVSVAGGISAGWGNTSYNDENWAPGGVGNFDGDWVDFNLYAVASYEVSDTLTAAASVTYTTLNGDAYSESAATLALPFEADNQLWGSVNIAYDF